MDLQFTPRETLVFFVHPIKPDGQTVYVLDHRLGGETLHQATPVAIVDIHGAKNRAIKTAWILSQHSDGIHGQEGFGRRLQSGELTRYPSLLLGVTLMTDEYLTRQRLKRERPEDR